MAKFSFNTASEKRGAVFFSGPSGKKYEEGEL
jgi:hypothetical protein